VLVATFGLSPLLLARVNSMIYRVRSRFQPGTETWDLILVAVLLPAIGIEIPLAALDAGRVGWSDVPLWVVLIGYVLLIGSIAITTWAQAVNPFFEPGVRIQKERAQRDNVRAVQIRPPSRLCSGDSNVHRNSAGPGPEAPLRPELPSRRPTTRTLSSPLASNVSVARSLLSSVSPVSAHLRCRTRLHRGAVDPTAAEAHIHVNIRK
jgi:hypothetical protein